MSFDITKDVRYTVHARDQMEDRLVDAIQAEWVRTDYHTSYPAERSDRCDRLRRGYRRPDAQGLL